MTHNQHEIRVNPVPIGTHIKFPDISDVPESKWYCYLLECKHEVYTRIRIRVPRDYSFMEHYIRCPVAKHTPLEWQGIISMKAVSDEHVSNVSSGSSFVLPNRILRVDGHSGSRVHASGNPFPYLSRDRDYD